jgi:outer membrane protein assembly factor BamB
MKSIALIALLGLLAGCKTISDGYDRVVGRSSVQRPVELPAIRPTASLRILWQGSVGSSDKNIYFPALAGRTVYAAGGSGGVTGFDAASGQAVARVDAGQRVAGGVGAGIGMVLLGTPRGEVLAFDRDGKSLWKAQLSSEVLAPPLVQDGIVVARSADGRVYGLDAASGARKWVYQRATPALSVRSHAGLVIERGIAFIGFPGGRLVALSIANGNAAWEAVVALPRGATELERVADITSLPVIDGPRICAVAFQGRVGCFDITRGTLAWARDVSSIAGLAIDARYLYVSDDRGAVVALDKINGSSIWRQDKLAGRGLSAPLAVGRHVAVGDIEGYVHLLSREDGAFAARIATDGSAISAPPLALDATTFLVQTRNGGVYAITAQ